MLSTCLLDSLSFILFSFHFAIFFFDESSERCPLLSCSMYLAIKFQAQKLCYNVVVPRCGEVASCIDRINLMISSPPPFLCLASLAKLEFFLTSSRSIAEI